MIFIRFLGKKLYVLLRKILIRQFQQVGKRRLPPSPPHFFAPEKMLRIFSYRAQKNVVYRRNVRRHYF